jgi:divalent metal cation (Fe/Co/Zn/Cd) transporter
VSHHTTHPGDGIVRCQPVGHGHVHGLLEPSIARSVDGFVSLGVIASAALVALGAPIADPLVGLAITFVILRITWDSLRTVRAGWSA